MKTIIVILLLGFYGLFLTHKINLVTADLGRHIKNGEFVFQNVKVLTTNFYSYTFPDFPVVNHHWLSGVIFYFLWKFSGFAGLQLFFIFISLVTFLIFFDLARRKVGIEKAGLISLMMIPLLGERTEIRPEVFSALFAGLTFWLMSQKISPKKLLPLLFLIQVFWVNTHVFFFLGPAIIGTFIFNNYKKVILALSTVIIASLINPFGLNGLLYPLGIFNNYAYQLAENQSVTFLDNYGMQNPNLFIFKIIFAVLVISFIYSIYKRKISLPVLFLAGGFSLMGYLQIRNFALFGFFALPIIAINFFALKYEISNIFITLGIFIVILFFILTGLVQKFPYWHEFGIGLEKNNVAALEFIGNNNMGKIFNNYDIGGFLIYALYPKNKVFIDNRPAEYPGEFFTKTYIPMQDDELIWKEQLNKYKFDSIIFSYNDMTPWGQKFMVRRLKDPEWERRYLDNYVVIFKKRFLPN
ncbi:MAG: hypothetical protein Q7S14_03250 [bacterium]|nr:hypothetical protein [bacterium]